MTTAKEYFDKLNQDYLAIHKEKEDLFWTTYMGTSNDQESFARAETKWMEFISDAGKIPEIRLQLEKLRSEPNFSGKDDLFQGLTGWLNMFEANTLESEEVRKLKIELIKREADLFEKRKHYNMLYTDENGNPTEGSLTVLSASIRASKDEQVRKSSHQALLDLEQWFLSNGFIDLIKERNRFAGMLGYENFFDYSIKKKEQMTTTELFKLLDDFEQRTRERNLESIKNLIEEQGEQSVSGYNFSFAWGGDSLRDLDPYVPFSKSLRQWVESFGRLNIEFMDAELTLDLLDRKGKYENGFCHGPVPSFYDNGTWIAAKVNFTSNAKPDQIGSGYDGINTLFHEGGHAAHFANITMNAPCFSQEFAPTSMALAETQSMFCDSLLSDADWLKRYAKDKNGKPVPESIIKSLVENRQPFMAYSERSILVVPYFERAVYLLPEDKLTPGYLTKLARETEFKILGLKVSPRPLMAIPHLMSDESACSYQGYLLAHMAVYQTRSHFMEQFGHLTDNPEIGPLMTRHYWSPGNSVSHDATIRNLTGEGFNAKYLANMCNLSVEETWNQELLRIENMNDREQAPIKSLQAKIKIVDGDTVLASNDESDDMMCSQFESYIESKYEKN
jgi:oligoendopeptidase F